MKSAAKLVPELAEGEYWFFPDERDDDDPTERALFDYQRAFREAGGTLTPPPSSRLPATPTVNCPFDHARILSPMRTGSVKRKSGTSRADTNPVGTLSSRHRSPAEASSMTSTAENNRPADSDCLQPG